MTALDLDGLTDAQLRLFAVRCARRVQHLMTDPRSIAALDVAERYARGEATDEELSAAAAAAMAAAAAGSAGSAAWAAADAAWAAVKEAAWAAASAAASAAEAAARAAASLAARTAAWAAERAEQQKILGEIRGVKP